MDIFALLSPYKVIYLSDKVFMNSEKHPVLDRIYIITKRCFSEVTKT